MTDAALSAAARAVFDTFEGRDLDDPPSPVVIADNAICAYRRRAQPGAAMTLLRRRCRYGLHRICPGYRWVQRLVRVRVCDCRCHGAPPRPWLTERAA